MAVNQQSAWILICLSALSGCSTQVKTVTVVETVVEKQYPPTEWLKDCPDAPLAGSSFKDAIAQSIKREAVIRACNVDKQSLREWVLEGSRDESQ
ncbi:Rz1-like lysis system protein LysC [Vibrio anguillarum]|uniref:Rz1-like lysis system protein LysC n=1 Tax=Vibrio anguillarum TaxID=55601 RepID=UPI003AF60258